MTEPHFLDAARRSRAVSKETNRYQVRADAPDDITFAPDVTKSHNSFKRIFHVPALPEPKEAMYNFEWDIAKHEGREYVPSSSFIIGDDEELTPAQKFAQETREKAIQNQMEPNEQKHISAVKTEPNATTESKMEDEAVLTHTDKLTGNTKSTFDENSKPEKSEAGLDNKEQHVKNNISLADEKKNEESGNQEAPEVTSDSNVGQSASNQPMNDDEGLAREASDPSHAENTEASEPQDLREPIQKDHDASTLEAEHRDHKDGQQADGQNQPTTPQIKANDVDTEVDPKEKAKMKAKIKAKAKKARKKAEKEQANAQELFDTSQSNKEHPIMKTTPSTSGNDPIKVKNQEGNTAFDESFASREDKEKPDQPDLLGESKKSDNVKPESSTGDSKPEEKSAEKADADALKSEDKTKEVLADKVDDEVSKLEDKHDEAAQKKVYAGTGNTEVKQHVPTGKSESEAPKMQNKAEKTPIGTADVEVPKSNKIEQVSAQDIDNQALNLEAKNGDAATEKVGVETLKSEGDTPVTEPAHLREQRASSEFVEQPMAELKQNKPAETHDGNVPHNKEAGLEERKAPNDVSSLVTKHSTMSKYAPSVSAYSVMADRALQGKFDGLPAHVQKDLQVKDYKFPPSISGRDDGRFPWNSSTWSSNRAFEMLIQQPKGRDSGTQWSEISGSGDATSSASQKVTLDIISTLFVPDPRTWRPYRFVRRTNPRQVLLMCAGTALSPQQIRSAEAAHRVAAGLMPREEATKSLASYYSTTENTNLQAGLGFIYSPDKAICTALREDVDATRVEKNFSRRLERPEFPATTTRHRAALRSVIAALEYIRWEEEGFDKIVLATHHGWIVRGISHDIWEWRQNGWKFMRNSVLGLPGENVPDRDLWELLDYVVRQYEAIDCNCRFWHIPKSTNNEAIALAEMGALKTNQQPSTVRWTKRK